MGAAAQGRTTRYQPVIRLQDTSDTHPSSTEGDEVIRTVESALHFDSRKQIRKEKVQRANKDTLPGRDVPPVRVHELQMFLACNILVRITLVDATCWQQVAAIVANFKTKIST